MSKFPVEKRDEKPLRPGTAPAQQGGPVDDQTLPGERHTGQDAPPPQPPPDDEEKEKK